MPAAGTRASGPPPARAALDRIKHRIGRGRLGAFLGTSGVIALSRVFGFAREMTMALVFGASLVYDMLLVAQRLRGVLETLLLETSFSRLLVRSFADRLGPRERLEAWVRNCLGLMLAGAALVSALALWRAGDVAALLAPGFDAASTAQTAGLLRMDMAVFPVTVAIGVMAAWLFTFGRTVVPNLLSIIRALCICAVGLWMYRAGVAEPSWVIAAGIVGICLGALVLYAWIKRVQPVPLLPTFRARDPEALGFFRNGAGVAGLSLPVQLQGLVLVAMGSQLATGAISWLYYSGKLVLLPQAVIGLGMGAVVIGRLSRLHAGGDEEGYRQTLNWSLRLVLLVSLPTAGGMVALAEPVVALALERGNFSAWDTLKTGIALRGHALAIPFQILNIVLLTALFAREMHLRAMAVNLLGAAVTIAGGYLLAVHLDRGHGGLSAVSGPAQLLVTLSLLLIFWRGGIWQPRRDLLVHSVRGLTATVAMGVTVAFLWQAWQPSSPALATVALIALGAALYPALLLLLGFRWRHLVPAGPGRSQ